MPAKIKYLIIARNQAAARKYAGLNGWSRSECKLAGRPANLDGISDLLAIFLVGWRTRPDHFQMIQAVNMAEAAGVRILMNVDPSQPLPAPPTDPVAV